MVSILARPTMQCVLRLDDLNTWRCKSWQHPMAAGDGQLPAGAGGGQRREAVQRPVPAHGAEGGRGGALHHPVQQLRGRRQGARPGHVVLAKPLRATSCADQASDSREQSPPAARGVAHHGCPTELWLICFLDFLLPASAASDPVWSEPSHVVCRWASRTASRWTRSSAPTAPTAASPRRLALATTTTPLPSRCPGAAAPCRALFCLPA